MPENGDNSYILIVSASSITKVDLISNEPGKYNGLFDMFNIVPYANIKVDYKQGIYTFE